MKITASSHRNRQLRRIGARAGFCRRAVSSAGRARAGRKSSAGFEEIRACGEGWNRGRKNRCRTAALGCGSHRPGACATLSQSGASARLRRGEHRRTCELEVEERQRRHQRDRDKAQALKTIHSASYLTLAAALLAGCAVGPNFQKPAAPEVSGYTPEPAGGDERRDQRRRRRAAALSQRKGHSGRMVDPLSLAAAGRSDRALAQGEPGHQGGAGRVGRSAGERAGAERRLLSQRRGRFLREPAEDLERACAHPQCQRVLLQPVHSAGQRVVRAGRVRPESADRGVPAGAGGTGALCPGRDAYHAERQRRRRGDPGGLPAGAGFRDARAHHDQHRNARGPAQAVCEGVCRPAQRRGAGVAARADRRHAAAAGQATGPAARPAGRSLRRFPQPGLRPRSSSFPVCSCRRNCR